MMGETPYKCKSYIQIVNKLCNTQTVSESSPNKQQIRRKNQLINFKEEGGDNNTG